MKIPVIIISDWIVFYLKIIEPIREELNMNKNYFIYLVISLLGFLSGSCTNEQTTWKRELRQDINRLGHRNWIVVTDMAYPLQSQPGIKTLYTGESYLEILSGVKDMIEKSPHIKANVFQDKELTFMEKSDATGITGLRRKSLMILGEELQYVPHEQLISRLDSISRVFNVIILKSNLTMPFTSTFFELDCRYWDETKQKELDRRISQ